MSNQGESRGLELHDDWLRVHFGGDQHADFHYRWLRHNWLRAALTWTAFSLFLAAAYVHLG